MTFFPLGIPPSSPKNSARLTGQRLPDCPLPPGVTGRHPIVREAAARSVTGVDPDPFEPPCSPLGIVAGKMTPHGGELQFGPPGTQRSEWPPRAAKPITPGEEKL